MRRTLVALGRLRKWVERRLTRGVLLIGAAIWGFIALADEVIEGDTNAFDEAVLLALRNPADLGDPIGPGWFEEMARDITALGGVGILVLVVLIVAGYLALARRPRLALAIVVANAGGLALSSTLKLAFDRPRPSLVPAETVVYTASFPSGHAMLSALVYLTLAVLLSDAQPSRTLKVYVVGVAVLLTLLIGMSRVYLGVHYPTDIVAGWVAGAAWALLARLALSWLQRP